MMNDNALQAVASNDLLESTLAWAEKMVAIGHPSQTAAAVCELARQVAKLREYLLLTDEQIARHTLAAGDCPPDSRVMLVSSIRRLNQMNAPVAERLGAL
jgi:hypothetical protein